MTYIDIDALDIDHVVDNSYKNFHVKNIDYICLNRTPEDTVKLYFFEDAAAETPEVVNPHWHRYDFWTTAITGGVENIRYRQSTEQDIDDGNYDVYNVFDYRTPLLGGNGFTFSTGDSLTIRDRFDSTRWDNSDSYFMRFDEIHTINILKPETCLMLHQYRDMVPDYIPTQTYSKMNDPDPTIADDGLYDRFTSDEIVAKLKWLNEKVGKQ